VHFSPALLGGITQWVTDVIESFGYIGVAALVALENIFPPIPSELILPLAGFLAGQGRFWLPAVILAATAGSVAGALVLYLVGERLGERRLRVLVDRYGRWFGLGVDDLDRADDWFDRHGSAAVLLCRLVPVVRSLVSIPAGLRRMPLTAFVLYTAVGSGLWNSALIGLGWLLGDQWHEVERFVGYFQYLVIAAAGIGLIWFIWKRRFSRTARGS
jgi:membrane protein DedA with SNARE-associated domain